MALNKAQWGLILITGSIITVASFFLILSGYTILALLPPLLFPLLIIVFKHPELLYYLMIIFIPLDAWQGLTQKYKFLTISKIAGILLVIILLAKLLQAPIEIKRFRTPMWYPLWGFFLIALLSSLFSDYFIVSLDNMRRFITAYLFLCFTIYFVDKNYFTNILPYILIIPISISASAGFLGKIFQIENLSVNVTSNTISQRATGGTFDPNFFAALILVSLPLICHMFFKSKKWSMKILFLTLFASNSYVIIITYSRAAILVYMITIMMLTIEYARKINLLRFGALIVATMILGSYLIYRLPDTFLWSRLKTLSSSAEDTSLSRRSSYIKVGISAAIKNPLLGSGPGTFPFLYEKSEYAPQFASDYSDWKRSAHNTYLEILAGTGITGLLAFLSIIGLSFKNYYSAQKKILIINAIQAEYIRILAYSFISFLTCFLFLSNVYHKYIWFFLGLSVVAERYSRHEHHAVENKVLNVSEDK